MMANAKRRYHQSVHPQQTYSYNGSAVRKEKPLVHTSAYDEYQPTRQPIQRNANPAPAVRPQPTVRGWTRCLLLLCCTIGMLFFVITRNLAISETDKEIRGVRKAITAYQKEAMELEIQLSEAEDIRRVQDMAAEMGLAYPLAENMRYLTLTPATAEQEPEAEPESESPWYQSLLDMKLHLMD